MLDSPVVTEEKRRRARGPITTKWTKSNLIAVWLSAMFFLAPFLCVCVRRGLMAVPQYIICDVGRRLTFIVQAHHSQKS